MEEEYKIKSALIRTFFAVLICLIMIVLKFILKEENIIDSGICSVCNSSICIAQNGNVFPCAGWQNYILGNLSNNSLADIWYHSKKVHYLRNLKRKDFKKCNDCQQRDYCTICMVRNFNESPTKDPLDISKYFCKVAEIKKRLAEKE